MKNDPFFSIVIPVFNRMNFIGKTIASILGQSFGEYEIIIVDDGSTDETANYLKLNFGSNPAVKIISQPNSERGTARNKGFRNASGNYVVFFDSDDTMHPNHLEVLHRKIIHNNYPDFIATKFDFVNEAGKSKPSDMYPLREGYYDYKLFLSGNPLACNICVRVNNPDLQLFEEDRKYAIKEDWMFLIQNTKKHPVYIVDEVTLSMSDHAERSMRSDNRLIIQKTFLARDWILQKIDLTEKEKKQLSAHVNYFCAIHAYLEQERKKSMEYVFGAIQSGGLKIKYLILLLKSILGRNVISKFQ